MLNLKHLSDQDLLSQTKQAVAKELEATTSVLHHLLEIQKRMLYASLGWSSLFEYAVHGLGYSESAAARRVNAMRLIQAVPEVAKSIENGSLSLSNASQIQTFFKREAREQGKVYKPEQKQEILKSIEQKSKRECEKILMTLSPSSAIPTEKIKLVSETQSEMRVILSDDVMKKLEKIRGLWGHKNPSGSYSELIGMMADAVLEKIDPEKKEERTQERRVKKEETKKEATQGGSDKAIFPLKITSPASSSSAGAVELKHPVNPRFISAEIRRQVFIRDGNQCSYVSAQTGRRCQSRFNLELDHIRPVALYGGASTAEELRLLCRSHNVYAAQRVFGSHMKKFVPSLR